MANIDPILAPGQSVNKQLLRQYLASREVSRPQDYGAKGDGINDDTDAINQALANDKVVFLPPGTYRTTDTITLSNGCTLIGYGEASVIQGRDTPYDDADPGDYPSTFNTIEITAGYNIIQNLKIVGGSTGIKLYGGDNPCVKNIIENISIWDTQHGIILDGWNDTTKPCYWNQFTNILIARPKINGVLFTITPTHADDPSTYGDTPNSNKFDNVRVYSLGAPMSGCGFTASRRSTWTFAAMGQKDLVDFIVKSGEIPPMLRIGYFSGENTFQATKWMQDASVLQRWMQTLDCKQGYTQIWKLFGDVQRQIAKGVKIASVIYVGDHCEDDAATVYEQAKSIGKTTPIHILHEVGCEDSLDPRERQAREIFQRIAKLSGGHYVSFPQGKYIVMSDVAKVLVGKIYGPKSKVVNDLKQNASKLSPQAKLLLG